MKAFESWQCWNVITGVRQARQSAATVEHVTARHLRLHGLTINEFVMLAVLADRTDATTRCTDLADAIGMTTGGITRLTQRAALRGYVGRKTNDADRRSSLVWMTDFGRQRLDAATLGFTELVVANLNQDHDERLVALGKLVETTTSRANTEHGRVPLGVVIPVGGLGAAAWGWFHSSSAPNGATVFAVLFIAVTIAIVSVFVRWYRRREELEAAYTKDISDRLVQDTSGDHVWDA